MAVSEKMRLKAQAIKLNIDGARQMGLEDLKAAIKTATTATTGKGKDAPATNGAAKGKGKAVEAVSSAVAKGKASTKIATTPAKGKAATESPATPVTPAKGKASTSSPAKKSTAQKSTPAKETAAQGTAKRTTTGGTRKRSGNRLASKIDASKIDWTVESKVGQTGKRKTVLDSLRKHEGNYAKVFKHLRAKAIVFYPDARRTFPNSPNVEHAAERMLKWLIGRVAYDYTYKTGQHQQGNRKWSSRSEDAMSGSNRKKNGGMPEPAKRAARGKAGDVAPGKVEAKLALSAAQKRAAAKQAAAPAKPAAAKGKAATPAKGKGTGATKGR